MENTEKKRVMLEDEELEKVSGGDRNELLNDADVLKTLGYLNADVTSKNLINELLKIRSAWQKLDVTLINQPDMFTQRNRYLYNNREYTQEQLYEELGLL